jgi:hypothetical protein
VELERDKLSGLNPLSLKGVDLGARGTLGFHLGESLGEGGDGGVGNAKDELMVADIDGGEEQLAALRVGAGNDQVLGAHDVPLEAGGLEAVDVLTRGDQHLAGKVAALLAAMHLVLKVDAGRAVLGKQLG